MSTQGFHNDAAATPFLGAKNLSLTVEDRTYNAEEVRTIASSLLTRFAADFGLVEWSLDDEGEMIFYQPICCDHDCAAEDDDDDVS